MNGQQVERATLQWTVVDRLRKAREEALNEDGRVVGLSQQELADRVDISLRSVVNYEDPTYPSTRKSGVIKRWALACGYSYEMVAYGVDPTLPTGGPVSVESGSPCTSTPLADVLAFRRAS